MSVVNVPGLPFTFAGGRKLVIPPLALGDLEQLLDRLNRVMSEPLNTASAGTVIDAAFAALRRNYPELTREEVGQLVDLANMREVIEAVMNASGLEPKAVDQSGEVQAPSTGASSTLT